jgi:hypothetical protein
MNRLRGIAVLKEKTWVDVKEGKGSKGSLARNKNRVLLDYWLNLFKGLPDFNGAIIILTSFVMEPSLLYRINEYVALQGGSCLSSCKFPMFTYIYICSVYFFN